VGDREGNRRGGEGDEGAGEEEEKGGGGTRKRAGRGVRGKLRVER